jgi:hypothetical protein
LKRSYNWEYTLGVQHELLPRVSVSATYFRRTWGNLRITQNSLIGPGDYTSFQTAMPSVANDPAVAAVINASDILTVYNLDKAKQPIFNTQLVDTNAPNDKSIYNGFEVGFSARFGSRGTVFGNWSIERNLSVFCTYRGDPNGPAVSDLYNTNSGTLGVSSVSNGGRFCDQRQFSVPFVQQFKTAGNFPIWFGIEIGLVWQSNPGRERPVTWTVPANLFPGGRTNTETIFLNAPGSLYEPRWNELDINLRKNFRFGRHVLTGELDLYNAFNTSAILATLDSVGASLGSVTQTLNGRMPRIALQYKF